MSREPLRRRSFTVAGARGYRWGELPPDLERELPEWIRTSRVADGVEIKPERVYRWRDCVVKFTPARRGVRHALRSSAAIRSARLAEKLRGIRTPRPWVALDVPSEGGGRRGLLVTEFIEGRFIEEIWRGDPLAMERFVDLMVRMHRRRVFHGDFHFHNVIWNGEDWFLIDLEGIRQPLRTLKPRRLIEDHWARIHFCLALPDELRAHFERYLELAGLDWDPTEAWESVSARSRGFLESWGAPPVQPGL